MSSLELTCAIIQWAYAHTNRTKNIYATDDEVKRGNGSGAASLSSADRTRRMCLAERKALGRLSERVAALAEQEGVSAPRASNSRGASRKEWGGNSERQVLISDRNDGMHERVFFLVFFDRTVFSYKSAVFYLFNVIQNRLGLAMECCCVKAALACHQAPAITRPSIAVYKESIERKKEIEN